LTTDLLDLCGSAHTRRLRQVPVTKRTVTRGNSS